MARSMLDTKFYRPRSRPGALSRARLVDVLDRGTAATLTLVSAPAGFGKTTLLAQWLERCTHGDRGGPSVAWLSLDAGDNEPRTYWTYLMTALGTAVPEVAVQELTSLQAADPPPIRGLLTPLLNDLGALPTDLVLVLDDYHVIESREVHEAMAFLLEHAPPRLHLVITSRADPAFPLARLRARGQLVEVRSADLRFTSEEAASYFDAMGLGLSAAEVSTLGERTEGWIAALQLAALSVQGREDVAGFIESFTGNDRYIVDYLVEEVLQTQPDHIEQFLLQTSILDRLTGAVCDAVTEQDGGKATLEALDRANLFLVPLDDHRRWYRYHHLFVDVLRARLLDEHPQLVPELHRRASGWHEQAGERAEAIRHALIATDFARAADLVEREYPASRRDRREGALLGWLKALPDEVLRNRPVLSVAYAGALLSNGAVEGVEQRLLDAERWLSTTGDGMPASKAGPAEMVVINEAEFRRLPGWVAIYRGAQALVQGETSAAVVHAHGALALLDEADKIAIAAASALLGLASWGQGDLDAAHQAYAACSTLFHQTGHLSDVLACAITLADICVTQGRLREAMCTYERALPRDVRDRSKGAPVLRGTADMYVGMSEVHRERNELDAAKQCLRISSELGEHNGLPQNRYRSRVAMARVHEAEGDLDAALDLLDDADRTYVADFAPEVRPVSALKARLWVRQGRLDQAFAWAQRRGVSVDEELSYRREFEHLTLARLLIARSDTGGSEHDLAAANRLLDRLLGAAEEGGRTGSVLQVLVLQALGAQLRDETSLALMPLHRALESAAPEGYVRVFLDEGPAMTTLLRVSAARGVMPDYAGLLLGAAPVQLTSSTRPRPLVEPLSERERDVLRLLATDLAGPDIARELVISLSTVRTHTRSIYAKLGVTGRRAAVRRAGDLNLLRTGQRPH